MTLLAFFSNLAGPSGFLLLLVIVLLFNGKRLPKLARGFLDTISAFRQGKDEGLPESSKPSKEKR
jgi:Sec-independent protein translocase protein TatA